MEREAVEDRVGGISSGDWLSVERGKKRIEGCMRRGLDWGSIRNRRGRLEEGERQSWFPSSVTLRFLVVILDADSVMDRINVAGVQASATQAGVVKLVDTLVLGISGLCHGGSTPPACTD